MNIFYAVATAALAFAVSVNGEPCPQDVQTAAVNAMLPLVSDPSFTECAKSTGYDMMAATSLPAPEIKVAMCNVQACKDLISKTQATNPPDCDLLNPMSNGRFNIKLLISDFWNSCVGTHAEARSANPKPTSYSFRSF